jgi:hypothetical protein
MVAIGRSGPGRITPSSGPFVVPFIAFFTLLCTTQDTFDLTLYICLD